MVGAKTTDQISELQLDKFTTPSSFMYWKIRFKTQVSSCSDFTSDAMLWIKEVEMVDSVDGWIKNHRDRLQVRISRILNCWTRELLLLWTRSSIIPLQKKGQSGGTESSERGPISSRKTDRLLDLRLLLSHWCSRYRSWLCWFIFYHSSQRQCSGLRYDMGWNSIVYVQDPVGWCSGQSVRIEITGVWSTQKLL